MRYLNMRFILSLIGLMVIFDLFGQDDHNYSTPIGKTLYFKTVLDADRTHVSMNEISPLSEGKDGLTVACHLRAQLHLMSPEKKLKIMSFTVDTEDHSFLDVFYQNQTITLRRKIAPGSALFYDYNLYEPMFLATSESTTWGIYIYFTGYYLWIETQNFSKTVDNYWHAPIFFGINLPAHNYMQEFLRRSSNAKIFFGDAHPPVVFTMPDEIVVNEFKYTELKDELQTHFSNPH